MGWGAGVMILASGATVTAGAGSAAGSGVITGSAGACCAGAGVITGAAATGAGAATTGSRLIIFVPQLPQNAFPSTSLKPQLRQKFDAISSLR